MKILHYSHCDLGSNEASTVHVMEFAERLARRGHRVRVVVPRWGRPYPYPARCEIQYFPILRRKRCRQISAICSGFFVLLQLKRRWRPDCIYTRRLLLNPMPGLFARLTRTPLITETNGQIEIHRSDVPLRALWRVFWYPVLLMNERILFACSTAVTADGAQRLAAFRRRYPAWRDRFRLVRGGGVDLGRFRPGDKERVRRELDLAPHRKHLIWVGRFAPWSGVEILFAAAKKILSREPQVDLILVGEGPGRERWKTMMAQAGLRARVRFVGSVANADLHRWLVASDVGLAPYNGVRLGREDFTSYKIFEYLACGLPVVCCAAPGESNISYVRRYDLGAEAPAGDADAFGEAIQQVLQTPSYFSPEFGERARRVLREAKTGWDEVVDEVEALCRSAGELPACHAVGPGPGAGAAAPCGEHTPGTRETVGVTHEARP